MFLLEYFTHFLLSLSIHFWTFWGELWWMKIWDYLDSYTIIIHHFDALKIINYYMYSRQPKVILTNILTTKTGRNYMQKQLLTDAKLSDANKLQSDEQPSLSISSLKSCQTISSQQSCILSKRYVIQNKCFNDCVPLYH